MQHDRPHAFLVSTSGGPASTMLQALAPALERLGNWRLIEHPETSLAFAASRAEAAGFRAVHLAIGRFDSCYLTPAVPTAFVPIWDYPDLPTRDLARNGLSNGLRIAEHLDLILAPSEFVAATLRRAGVSTPIAPLPIPARAGYSDLPTWGHGLPVTVEVRHLRIVGEAEEDSSDEETILAIPLGLPGEPTTLRGRIVRGGKRRLRRLKPFLSNATVQRLDGIKRKYAPIVLRPNPVRLLGRAAAKGYRRLVRRWISDEAHRRLVGLKRRVVMRRSVGEIMVDGSSIASAPLTLSGLVYSAVVDFSDPTTDESVLLSAALHAFRDRPDVTLLVHLATTTRREKADLDRLRDVHRSLRLQHRCRLAIVIGPVDDATALDLCRGSSYQVETSRGRAWPAAIIEAMAAGRPAIAPAHSGLADWMDRDVGLVVGSSPEPAAWPIDPHRRPETTWDAVGWASLRDRLIESATIADDEPVRYEALSAAGRRRVAERASVASTAESLRLALDLLPVRAAGAVAWSVNQEGFQCVEPAFEGLEVGRK